MTATAEKLVESALELDEEERGEVVARLLSSLEVELPGEAAWAQELERRAAELESGQVTAIPWEEVERLLRRFPFSLVYREVGDQVRVLAVAHHKRRAAYWTHRT